MFRRLGAISDPVTFRLDGSKVEGARGEPIAVAILASGERRIARSPKLHRARGPSCLRGDCDGCLARVDGEPNVMTCMRSLAGGEDVSTQNVLGTKDIDLLRITDWFFPKGIDHHHLLAGVPGISDVMQGFARRMAGIGRLPKDTVAPRAAERVVCDALVIGGGLAGCAAARTLAAAGKAVHLVDDGVQLGGSARAAGRGAMDRLAELDLTGVEVHRAATVAGVYDGEAVVASSAGARLIRPAAFVLATGAHDGALALPNNDLPGVLSARALAALAASGVVPTGKVAVIGDGPWARALEVAIGPSIAVRAREAEVDGIKGSTRVKGVVLRDGRSIDVEIVATAGPSAPAFELAEGLDATIEPCPDGAGYRPVSDADGRIGEAAWAVGECAGEPFDVEALLSRGEAVARAVLGVLGASRSADQPSMSVSKSPSPPATNTAAKSRSKRK
ncbi:MAG: (2Fe-2S)-binding protein [Polyangiaceae bacterium]